MTYSEAYEKALQLLNVRFLSEGELRTKLRRRDVRDDGTASGNGERNSERIRKIYR